MNLSPYALLKTLADGEFHSGQKLADQFNVSRMAICQHMEKVKAFGFDVQAVTRKGYCLGQTLNLLNEESIKKALPKKFTLHCLPTLGSTNEYLLNYLQEHPGANYHIGITEQQTAGRGRRGRTWHSPFGQNIYCSLLWKFEQGVGALGGLSLVIALSILETLQKQAIHDLKIKWPNDVLWQSQKLAGILVDLRGDAGGPCYAVMGMGINVNMPACSAIDQAWTSLQTIAEKVFDRNTIIISLIKQLKHNLAEFSKSGFKAFLPQWQMYDALYEHPVTATLAHQKIQGTAKGVNTQGDLLLKGKSDATHTLKGGEVSVRRR